MLCLVECLLTKINKHNMSSKKTLQLQRVRKSEYDFNCKTFS